MSDEVYADKRLARIGEHFARLGFPPGLTATAIGAAAARHGRTATPDPNSQPWVPAGARNIGGRIRTIAQHPTDPRIIYAGSAYGGVFRTLDGGDTWAPLGHPWEAMPVGDIAIAPSDPNVVYVASGEMLLGGNFGAMAPAGYGFFRYDALTGRFTQEVGPMPATGAAPAGASVSYGNIAVDPNDADRCWLAATTGLWRRERINGVVQFTQDLPASVTQRQVSDVVLAPDLRDPRKLWIYVAVFSDGVYRAVYRNGSFHWQGRTPTTAATGALQRIRLATCPRRPQRVYALIENGAGGGYLPLEISDNHGRSWATRPLMGGLGTFPWWCSMIAVHPQNPDVVIVGSVQLDRSLDGGRSWQRVVNWSLSYEGQFAQHADQHDGFFDNAEPEAFWLANDGGISRARDMINENPAVSGGWRKRSHGILCGQFNDITINPTYPQMMGGGLQDNGTWGGFGGPTWYHIGFGDGGEMAYEVNNPRQWYPPSQGGTFVATPQPPTFVPTNPPWRIWTFVNADQPANLPFVVQIGTVGAMASAAPFVGVIKHHPVTANHFLVGRRGQAFWTGNAGGVMNSMGLGGGPWISTVNYAPPTPPNAASAHADDWWIGDTRGRVYRMTGATSATKAAAALGALPHPTVPGTSPPTVTRPIITDVAIHPADPRYVIVTTGADQANNMRQGQVYLSLNSGTTWQNLTITGSPPASSLPTGPIMSAVFDPRPAAAANQVVYVGTAAGVYVCRNLPPRLASPPPGPIVAVWRSFNNIGGSPARPGPLPITLVVDLEIRRNRLYAATHGRGVYECDLTGGMPRHQLYIRQHLVEDGLTYPRPTPAALNGPPPGGWGGDPRYPAGTLSFTDTEAYDIRVDNAPFRFLDVHVDGVEFDTELITKSLVPGQRNAVYVQVHTRGWGNLSGAAAPQVHLFYATTAAPAGPATAPSPNLPANFWNTLAGTPPAGAWRRVDQVRAPARVSPEQPAVVRFDWIPPAALGGTHVALLAVCTSSQDAIGVTPSLNLATLVRSERRAAYRVVPALAFRPQVFIRDGVDDPGEPGAIIGASRSPDIIVVPAVEPSPTTRFADLMDPREGDRLRAGQDNHVYVRVFNKTLVPVTVDVDLFHVRTNVSSPPTTGPFVGGDMQPVAPVGSVTHVALPADGWGVAHLRFNPGAAVDHPTDQHRATLLVALVHSSDGVDAAPIRARIRDPETLWRFFRELADSDNAAMRAVRFA